ncbi:MAG: KH domain-containing protein [Deltaproteobacteria bacterium]|nr:KH domain-containing protein [Deltaproteobacteria bacterium]
MDELLRYVASVLVDAPDEVVVTREDGEDGETRLRLSVRRDDVGKVIGKQGRTARAIRNLVQSAAALRGERIHVQVVDD